VTPEQIRKWSLPSRPSKTTDTRYADFRRRFGAVASTELDAIPPGELRELVEHAILDHVDVDQLESIVAEQTEARTLLQKTFGEMLRGAA
jgi:hypothetical protein